MYRKWGKAHKLVFKRESYRNKKQVLAQLITDHGTVSTQDEIMSTYRDFHISLLSRDSIDPDFFDNFLRT